MALYTETFVIVNNSPYTLTLDTHGSSGLGNGDWPTTIAPNTTAPSFVQTGNFDVNPTAVYIMNGANTNVYLHFYCTGLDPLLHVNMTMTFSNGAPCSGSSIAENNSHSDQFNNTTLSISTTDDGSSTGTATFTIC